MKSIIYTYRNLLFLGLVIIGRFFTACTPDEADYELSSKAEAAFTVKDISSDDMRNTYALESTTDNAFLYQWDLGNGTDPFV